MSSFLGYGVLFGVTAVCTISSAWALLAFSKKKHIVSSLNIIAEECHIEWAKDCHLEALTGMYNTFDPLVRTEHGQTIFQYLIVAYMIYLAIFRCHAAFGSEAASGIDERYEEVVNTIRTNPSMVNVDLTDEALKSIKEGLKLALDDIGVLAVSDPDNISSLDDQRLGEARGSSYEPSYKYKVGLILYIKILFEVTKALGPVELLKNHKVYFLSEDVFVQIAQLYEQGDRGGALAAIQYFYSMEAVNQTKDFEELFRFLADVMGLWG